jgi:pyridoxine/pyridoxamine 5'-phosphate oxidase
MSWIGAIHSQRQSDEIVRLRGQLEQALNRIQQLESKIAESKPEFWEVEAVDSGSPHFWMTETFISR